MIGFLKGCVEWIYEDYVSIDVNGVGYNVYMSANSLFKLEGMYENIKVYTYLSVREDAMLLYGFLEKNELDLFKMLIQVNGIGPKAGLSIMSTMSISDLKLAILSEDAKAIAKAPGVGAKSAQRIIIDLKDKISKDSSGSMLGNDVSYSANDADASVSEAIEALCALGYSKRDAIVAVNQVKKDAGDDVPLLIKLALKQMI